MNKLRHIEVKNIPKIKQLLVEEPRLKLRQYLFKPLLLKLCNHYMPNYVKGTMEI